MEGEDERGLVYMHWLGGQRGVGLDAILIGVG